MSFLETMPYSVKEDLLVWAVALIVFICGVAIPVVRIHENSLKCRKEREGEQ